MLAVASYFKRYETFEIHSGPIHHSVQTVATAQLSVARGQTAYINVVCTKSIVQQFAANRLLSGTKEVKYAVFCKSFHSSTVINVTIVMMNTMRYAEAQEYSSKYIFYSKMLWIQFNAGPIQFDKKIHYSHRSVRSHKVKPICRSAVQ